MAINNGTNHKWVQDFSIKWKRINFNPFRGLKPN